jgi:hypothetical protein
MKKTPNKGGVYIACADGLLLGSLNYSNSAFIMLPKTPNITTTTPYDNN